MSIDLGALTRRLVHPTAPVLLTKIGPLGARSSCGIDFNDSALKQVEDLTHLKFENRLRPFRPQGL
jgi:hypothetical protein